MTACNAFQYTPCGIIPLHGSDEIYEQLRAVESIAKLIASDVGTKPGIAKLTFRASVQDYRKWHACVEETEYSAVDADAHRAVAALLSLVRAEAARTMIHMRERLVAIATACALADVEAPRS